MKKLDDWEECLNEDGEVYYRKEKGDKKLTVYYERRTKLWIYNIYKPNEVFPEVGGDKVFCSDKCDLWEMKA